MERTVIATPAEAYAGPVYSDPVVHSEIREITFLFPSESAAYLSGPLTPATLHTKGVMEIVGAARVDREEFPELLSAIKETNWPPLAQNKERHMPIYSLKRIIAGPHTFRRRVTKRQLFWT